MYLPARDKLPLRAAPHHPAVTPTSTATHQLSPAWPSRQRPGIQGGGAVRGTPRNPPPAKPSRSDPLCHPPIAPATTHALSSPQHDSEPKEVPIPQKNNCTAPYLRGIRPVSLFRKKHSQAIKQAWSIKILLPTPATGLVDGGRERVSGGGRAGVSLARRRTGCGRLESRGSQACEMGCQERERVCHRPKTSMSPNPMRRPSIDSSNQRLRSIT